MHQLISLPVRKSDLSLKSFGFVRRLGIRQLTAFVVAGEEDLMVLAETVYEAEKGVWGLTHRREDTGSV